MGRAPCCDKVGLKRGPWQPEEDEKLIAYIQKHGHENWRALPQKAGLLRCGKSCRLRWTNYLRPDIKRGGFSMEEDHMIIQLHSILGNRWSVIAAHMPGRTDNEIKNYWNTHLRKQLLQMGIDPVTHRLKNQPQGSTSGSVFNQMALWETARFQAESRLAREYLNFISRKQPMTSRNNDQVFAEWLEEYSKSFGKYLDGNAAGVQPSATDMNPAWTSNNALVLDPFNNQQFSDSSFGSECSTLPQLSEQDGSFGPLDIGDDEYQGGAARQDSILHATMLEDLRSPSAPPALTEFGSTCGIEDDGGNSSSSNIPPLDLSRDDQQFPQAGGGDLDLLELTTTESIASNTEYWSTILRIVGG